MLSRGRVLQGVPARGTTQRLYNAFAEVTVENSSGKKNAITRATTYIRGNLASRVPNARTSDYLQKVLTARVYDVCKETPLDLAEGMSERFNNTILLKREDLQKVFSFKLRGAYNKIANLTAEEKQRGIVCCSAGNHAQGVALSAAILNIDAVIVMPIPTPQIKVDGVRKNAGTGKVKVVLHGYTYDDAAAEAKRLEKEESRVFIHPFDDPYVIAGQGTIGLEIIKQTTAKPPDAIFCCVGGGGLLSGIAEVIKTVNPNIKVFGVEAEDSAAMTLSLDKGRREELSDVGIFADGAAVKLVGENTFRICDELVDGMITVSTDEICAAIKDGFNETRTVMEPAGALGIAGVKKFIQSTGVEGKDFVVVCSGSNTNFDRLRFVAERAIENETLLCVRIPEQIGSFQTLCESIVPRNITEFSYRFNDPAEAFIMMSFQSQGPEDAKQVLKDLRVNGMEGRDLTNDETSKLHFRYLAGGRSSAPNEVLYRFQFPETPGALIRFLRNFNGVNKGWNISMFHYRNLGADVGHILVGMQIPKEQRAKDLDLFLEEVGFNYYDETDNPVYKEFFRS